MRYSVPVTAPRLPNHMSLCRQSTESTRSPTTILSMCDMSTSSFQSVGRSSTWGARWFGAPADADPATVITGGVALVSTLVSGAPFSVGIVHLPRSYSSSWFLILPLRFCKFHSLSAFYYLDGRLPRVLTEASADVRSPRSPSCTSLLFTTHTILVTDKPSSVLVVGRIALMAIQWDSSLPFIPALCSSSV